MSDPQENVRSVEDVLITEELARRPWRPPDHSGENFALLALADELATNPDGVLQRAAELALQLCRAESAGVSILEPGGAHGIFRWHAIAGQFAANLFGTMPQEASPCGTVVRRNRVLLFQDPQRAYPALRGVQPPIHESLLVPWESGGKIAGTLWAVGHGPGVHFDAEDARLLTSVARVAASAWTILRRIRTAEDLRAERSAALNLMEDAITARQDAERAIQALRASEERVRLVVENAREHAIISLELDRTITSWNVGAQAIIGYTPEEAIGQTGDIIFTEEDRAAKAPEREASKALADGRAADERWHQRKDGTRFWGSGVMMAMVDPEGRAIGLVKIFRDETAELLAKEALEQSLRETERARAEAEAAAKAKDHFLAVLSHELRTPLTPVLMSVHSLSRSKGLSPEARESLEMIRRNVKLEAQLIDELLDLTRIARGKMELNVERLDLHEILHRAEEVVRADLAAKRQQLTLDLAAMNATVFGDAMRLQQIFWNLLRNASKFSPANGTITARTRQAEAASGQAPARIVVEVSDNGIGFAQADAERIFDPFTQASQDVAQKFGGLGLGLAISKASVEAHGGSIQATSPGPGHGATFSVELPLASLPA